VGGEIDCRINRIAGRQYWPPGEVTCGEDLMVGNHNDDWAVRVNKRLGIGQTGPEIWHFETAKTRWKRLCQNDDSEAHFRNIQIFNDCQEN
jgi:hypothetical protein